MFACFKTDGNSEFLISPLQLECRNSANISAFSLITLLGTSVSWYVLDVPKFKIYFSISSLHVSENEKGLEDLSNITAFRNDIPILYAI